MLKPQHAMIFVRVISRHLSRELPRVIGKVKKLEHELTQRLRNRANHKSPRVAQVATCYDVLRILHDIRMI